MSIATRVPYLRLIVSDEQEWNEPPRREVMPDRFTSVTVDRDYCAATNYKVTSDTFAREERRKGRSVDGDDSMVPPGGLICSARLGEVSTLL